MEKKQPFWENFITLMIFLVILQTFFEEVAVLADFDWVIRKNLLISGFFFDLIFTIEFLIRFSNAIFASAGTDYLRRRGGFVDLVASVPLLLFNSGPYLLAYLAGGIPIYSIGGVLGILKVVKAIRIARILRFLRVLKIFRQIKNTESIMGQRHIALLSGLSIGAVVGGAFFFAIFNTIFFSQGIEAQVLKNQNSSIELLLNKEMDASAIQDLGKVQTDLLLIKSEDNTLYETISAKDFRESYGFLDFRIIQKGDYTFYYNVKELNKEQARQNLLLFTVVFTLLGIMLLIYSPHFAITVTDPLHVMKRGFDEEDYLFEVKIQPGYEKDDIFAVSQLYNEKYLSYKERNQQGGKTSILSLDDIEDFL